MLNTTAESRFNAIPALFRSDDDEIFPEDLFVSANCDWNRIFASKDAMSPCSVAGLHASELKRDHAVVQQRHQPTNRTDESDATLARPGHGFRKVNARNEGRQFLPQHLLGRLSLYVLVKGIALAFRILHLYQLVNGCALLLCESFSRFSASGEIRTLSNNLCVGGPLEQPLGKQHQSPWCGFWSKS